MPRVNPTRFPQRSLSPALNYGGECLVTTAAGTLLVGDVVYWSAANTVAKSATAADYAAFVGVVVGGAQTANLPTTALADVGTNAALVGESVIVQLRGIVTVIAAAAISLGTRLQVVTTAGRVDDAVFVAGQTVGIALEAATNPGDKIAMLIQPK